jgi:hypothetical protein
MLFRLPSLVLMRFVRVLVVPIVFLLHTTSIYDKLVQLFGVGPALSNTSSNVIIPIKPTFSGKHCPGIANALFPTDGNAQT